MQRVQKVQTFDGKLFNTQKEAIKHLESLLANVYSKMAHATVKNMDSASNISYLTAVPKTLDENEESLVLILKIKTDMAYLDEE